MSKSDLIYLFFNEPGVKRCLCFLNKFFCLMFPYACVFFNWSIRPRRHSVLPTHTDDASRRISSLSLSTLNIHIIYTTQTKIKIHSWLFEKSKNDSIVVSLLYTPIEVLLFLFFTHSTRIFVFYSFSLFNLFSHIQYLFMHKYLVSDFFVYFTGGVLL